MKQGDSVKIAVAVVVLIAAGLLIAYQFGVFTSVPPPPAPEETGTPIRGQPRTAPGAPR